MRKQNLIAMALPFKWYATKVYDPSFLTNSCATQVSEFHQFIKKDVAMKLCSCVESLMDYRELPSSVIHQKGIEGSCYILNEEQMRSLIESIQKETEKALHHHGFGV